jgi:hypothetical protein
MKATTLKQPDAPEIEAVTELAELVEGFTSAISKKEALNTTDEVALEKIGEALIRARSALDLGHISSDITGPLVRSVRRIAQLAPAEIKTVTNVGDITTPALADKNVRGEIAKLTSQIVTKLAPAVIAEIHKRDLFRAEQEAAQMDAIAAAYQDPDLGPIMAAIEVQVTSAPEDGRFASWRVDPLRALCDAARLIADLKRREHPKLEGLLTHPPLLAENLGKFLEQRRKK